VLRDLAVLLADGGDCLSDLAVLRDQPALFGPVASTPTAWRVLERTACDPDGLTRLRAARAHARARAWAAGGDPHVELLIIDADATLVLAHSEAKEGAAGTYKHSFGFAPLLAYLDRGQAPGESLAGLLRPGKASPGTAGDLIELVDLALAQLPADERPVLVRSDSAGGSTRLAWHLRERGIGLPWGCRSTPMSARRSSRSRSQRGHRRSSLTASLARAPRRSRRVMSSVCRDGRNPELRAGQAASWRSCRLPYGRLARQLPCCLWRSRKSGLVPAFRAEVARIVRGCCPFAAPPAALEGHRPHGGDPPGR
jgi:Transposase DDE domain group 1